MDNGGHGIISYDIPKNSTTIEIPSLIGESFELKDGFKIVQAHTGIRFNKTAGAYYRTAEFSIIKVFNNNKSNLINCPKF